MMYPIVSILPEQVLDDEQLGSKEKFWFMHMGQKWLFKESRIIPTSAGEVVTGEDWAEKVAAELAQLIGIQAAHVELSEYEGKRGSASLSFITNHALHLEHGNEILSGRVLDYDPRKTQHQSDHTLGNIVRAIQNMFQREQDCEYILQRLAGYMVLDALICNTDRHHENWGLFWHSMKARDLGSLATDGHDEVRVYDMAPSFDHASSLGRELLDEKRMQLMRENRVEAYVRKGRGGIYRDQMDRHGANPLGLVESAARLYPVYFRPTLEKLAAVELIKLQALIDPVPDSRITETGKKFAKLMLNVTYSALIGLLK